MLLDASFFTGGIYVRAVHERTLRHRTDRTIRLAANNGDSLERIFPRGVREVSG